MISPTALPQRRIQLLPPGVAERIAAGEVIERPSSVVKELVENSIDAGATEVVVTLEDGGKGLIEVLDNGAGMLAEDLAVCIERHATSKLSSLEDLEKIRTLGFRGEALPSVAAVSDLSILSRARGPEQTHGTAHEITITRIGDKPDPRPVTFGHFLGAAHGTRIQARGLFSQIPARLKFLKSAGAEVSQVREWMERLALAHPEIGFKLLSENRVVLQLRPQDEAARVRRILGDDSDTPLVTSESREADEALSGLKIRVHWLQGLSSPQTRRLVQVVNGRAVRDRMLQQAMLSAFKQALLPGQFPAVALYLEIDPAQLDVNVHPTKTEIRFLDNRRIFHQVDKLIDAMIARHGAPSYASGPAISAPSFTSDVGSGVPIHARTDAFEFARPRAWGSSSLPTSETPSHQNNWTFSEPPVASALSMSTSTEPDTSVARDASIAPDASPVPTPVPTEHPWIGATYVGTLFQTYLLYDLGQELVLVDQHAAHERIRYEKLKKSVFAPAGGTPASQQLLLPEAIRFDAGERGRLEPRLEWLARLGFEAEIFGEDTALIRAIPVGWGTAELRVRLQNLLERVLAASDTPSTNERYGLDEYLFEKLASEACHSSVRAGDRLERAEAEHLVAQLFHCAHPWNCPHGRPTVTRVPRARFEEWFQRRVP